MVRLLFYCACACRGYQDLGAFCVMDRITYKRHQESAHQLSSRRIREAQELVLFIDQQDVTTGPIDLQFVVCPIANSRPLTAVGGDNRSGDAPDTSINSIKLRMNIARENDSKGSRKFDLGRAERSEVRTGSSDGAERLESRFERHENKQRFECIGRNEIESGDRLNCLRVGDRGAFHVVLAPIERGDQILTSGVYRQRICRGTVAVELCYSGMNVGGTGADLPEISL